MNVVHVVTGAVKGALVAWTGASSSRLLARLLVRRRGRLPRAFCVPNAGPGRYRRHWAQRAVWWLYTQQAVQGAADFAAVAAARGLFHQHVCKYFLLQAEAMTAAPTATSTCNKTRHGKP